MINNTTVASSEQPRNYWTAIYLEKTPIINQNQKDKLTALIYQNILDENECELRVSELEDLTEADASYALYQFSRGIWS